MVGEDRHAEVDELRPTIGRSPFEAVELGHGGVEAGGSRDTAPTIDALNEALMARALGLIHPLPRGTVRSHTVRHPTQ